MKINSIKIENFLGLSNFQANLKGRSVRFAGRNGVGKSTIANAILWCLFGKDSNGKELDPKPRERGGKGERITGNTPTVAIEFDNGEVFERKLLEDYDDKKGISPVYKGDKGDYLVNGVSVKKKDFEGRVIALTGDPDIFKLVLNPDSFLTMHWSKRREILEKLMGDVKLEQAVSSDLAILEGKPLKEAIDIVKAMIRKAEEELKTLPARIEEAQRSLPQQLVGNSEELQGKLDAVVKQRMQEEESCKNPEFGKVAELRYKATELKMEAREEHNRKLRQIDEQISNKSRTVRMLTDDVVAMQTSIGKLEKELKNYSENLESLRVQYKEAESREFSESNCITCGQKLPDFLLDEFREKFNLEKAETVKRLKELGREAKKNKEDTEKQLELLTEQLKAVEKSREHALDEQKSLEKQKEALPYTEPKEVAEIEAELKRIAETGEFKKSDKLYKLEGEESIIREEIASAKTSAMQFERVNELKERLKALGEELIEFKEKRHKLLNIQTEWNRAIEDKVNGLFEITKFRMSNELKNGELEDTCEAMFEGIDYNKTLNTGAKVCMTVDVANTFSREFNIDFTTIIDNSESVTDWLVKPKGQAIYLYALDDINELTMEVCNE